MTKVVLENQMNEICDVIQKGGIVAFPTETVYGVGIHFNDEEALERLMEAKNRDYSKAITLMVADKADISQYAYISPQAQKMIDQFMPGMITLIFKKKESVHDIMTNGKSTIGIRIPDSEFVLSLLKKVGPMLVTSANLSQHSNTTSTQEVLNQLDGRIDLVVDGKTSDNIASTVVDVSQDEIKILRAGKITKEQIEEAIK
ncbi:L-threonylcarbamoyladenylate synthase [Massilimicrobiota timonensis]|uniref:L-threonylcarbamoyladenylate synthase n=1 Tax=Massilimicrobiota timonensis TaxID=1776392 RepID=A0ABT7UG73_9FIRM|nr:L-threonylcarbamoyladenylate synthase [Massilimicrobiota timonensis]MDM8195144.1 L-threonylcarbamoyladenylate synthase [Massilimicrobiota timonensis]